MHKAAFRVLQGLVVPLITDDTGADARGATLAALAVAVLLGGATALVLTAQLQPAQRNFGHQQVDED